MPVAQMKTRPGVYGWGTFDEVEAAQAPKTFAQVEAEYAGFTAAEAEARLAAMKKAATMKVREP